MVLFALAGCTKEPVESLDGPQDAVLSVAEANWEGSSTAARSVAEDGAAQTRAIVDGAGHTFFTDRDQLGLFLRGDGYEDVDNRMVRLNYPGEGSEKEWQITGTLQPRRDGYGLFPLLSAQHDVGRTAQARALQG